MKRFVPITLIALCSLAVGVAAHAQTLSPGAKAIYDEMTRDTTGARAACRGGPSGMQSFVG